MKRIRVITFLGLCTLLLPSLSDAKTQKRTESKTQSVLSFIEKVNNHWQSVNSPDVRAFWDNAAYFTGNMEAYKLTGNAAYLEYSDKWCRHNRWQGATEVDPLKWLYKNYGEDQQHVLFGDWQICFQTYLDMYMMNPDAYKIKRVKEVMDRECAMPDHDFWWWADALYMVMPVMTKMYQATGDTKYLDKLYDNFLYADNLMYDQKEHLYYRDGKYIYPAHKTNNGLKDFWARGDGWVLAGLAKVLQDMPKDYSHRSFFVQRFTELAAAVAKCQQPQGYWTRSILDKKQAEGPETSGTAFFTYGLLWGMNHGLLDRATYQPVADKAWKYLSIKALQSDGSIGYVQPIGEKAIPGQQLDAKATANFGVGAFLLAACEKVRFDDASVNPVDSKTFEVSVVNQEKTQRQQVIELDAKTVFSKLGICGGRQFIVTNALGREVPYQLTYDGKVLIEAWINPSGTAIFKISKGIPSTPINSVYGRMYPERVDDIAWENDRCAYRCYGPALQKTGEDAYGNDVWVKNTPDLVVEQRYYTEDIYKKPISDLRKAGKKAEAQELEDNISYHFDHGHGLDCYKVGPTLGCGTPALMDGDKILFPYCYKDYQILDNGPLRFTVKLVYNPATIKNDKNVVETRIVSLDKGTNFNKMTVSYDGLTSPCEFAAGVVIHSEDTVSVKLARNYVSYADPTDNPKGQNFQIYVATLFPNGIDQTKKLMYSNPSRGNAGHALGITTYKPGDKYTYYFGSAWSKYDCRSFAEWSTRIDSFLCGLESPLIVTVK
jgi:rhamnogalacturonyl hydrolase YesR